MKKWERHFLSLCFSHTHSGTLPFLSQLINGAFLLTGSHFLPPPLFSIISIQFQVCLDVSVDLFLNQTSDFIYIHSQQSSCVFITTSGMFASCAAQESQQAEAALHWGRSDNQEQLTASHSAHTLLQEPVKQHKSPLILTPHQSDRTRAERRLHYWTVKASSRPLGLYSTHSALTRRWSTSGANFTKCTHWC